MRKYFVWLWFKEGLINEQEIINISEKYSSSNKNDSGLEGHLAFYFLNFHDTIDFAKDISMVNGVSRVGAGVERAKSYRPILYYGGM